MLDKRLSKSSGGEGSTAGVFGGGGGSGVIAGEGMTTEGVTQGSQTF